MVYTRLVLLLIIAANVQNVLSQDGSSTPRESEDSTGSTHEPDEPVTAGTTETYTGAADFDLLSADNMYPTGSTNLLDSYSNSDIRFAKICATYKRYVEPLPYFNLDQPRHLSVCNNGMMIFANQPLVESHPRLLNTVPAFKTKGIMAPFWGKSNEATMSQHSDTNKRTQILVNDMERAAMSDDVLELAKQDATEAGGNEDFVPKWMLVATWVRLPYDDLQCRERSLSHFQNPTNESELEHQDCVEHYENLPTNTFQAVYMTDGSYAYIKFIYPEGGISWVYPSITYSDIDGWQSYLASFNGDLDDFAVGGLISGDDDEVDGLTEVISLSNSGSFHFLTVDEAPGNYEDERIGEYVYRVDLFDGTVTAETQCDNWVNEQDLSLVELFNALNPCPTNVLSASRDWRFVWTSTQPDCYESRISRAGFKQRCCYSTNQESLGSLIKVLPDAGFVKYESADNVDDVGYKLCCTGSVQLCKLFHIARPINTGEGYLPIATRPAFGDPHFLTSDGVKYTFNGLGEYLFTRIGSDSQIQVRTERVISSNGEESDATYFSAICVNISGRPRVQIQVNKTAAADTVGVENQLQLIVNGVEENIGLLTESADTAESIDGVDSTIQFQRTPDDSLIVYWEEGVSVTIWTSQQMLAITLGLSSSLIGETIGLTGVYDRNASNEFTFLNGTISELTTNSSDKDIFDWASTFAVSEEDSIMYYTEAGTDWSTYNNNSFVPVFTDDIDSWVWPSTDLENQAFEACGNNTACLYDIYITGDVDAGTSAKQIEEDSEEANRILNNFSPVISGQSSTMANVGEAVALAFSITDPNDDEIKVSTNLDTTIITNVGDLYLFEFTMPDTTAFTFTIIAEDSNGAVATETPTLMICQCVNNATCEELSEIELELVQTSSVLLDCICPTGYTGDTCESDIDACSLVAFPCYPSLPCIDSPAPADEFTYTCGDCSEGYTGDGKSCTDIDECDDESLCSGICINYPGSYACTCESGYQLNDDEKTCDDIDECITQPCHHSCTNTAGSFNCSCDAGYSLNEDGINCDSADPCTNSNTCDADNGLCTKVNGTEVCSCVKGYTLNDDGETCDETDECALGTDACESGCKNTDGGYQCTCNSGYELSSDGRSCQDINECVDINTQCPETKTCSNIPASYECICNPTQVESDGKCITVNPGDPVEEITTEPSKAALKNGVQIDFKDMKLEEYTYEKEELLFENLAKFSNEHCEANDCGFISEESSRKKRNDVTFTAADFYRIKGSPSFDDGNTQASIYALISDVGILSANDLLTVMTNAQNSIESDLGYVMNAIERVTALTTTVAPTTTLVDEEVSETPKSKTGVYVAIGVSAGLFVVVIVVVLVCLKMKMNKSSKTAPVGAEESAHKNEVVATSMTQRDPEQFHMVETGSARPGSGVRVSEEGPGSARPGSGVRASEEKPGSARPGSGVHGSEERPGSGSKQTQDHSRAHTPTVVHPAPVE